jgi:hypothetical protein
MCPLKTRAFSAGDAFRAPLGPPSGGSIPASSGRARHAFAARGGEVDQMTSNCASVFLGRVLRLTCAPAVAFLEAELGASRDDGSCACRRGRAWSGVIRPRLELHHEVAEVHLPGIRRRAGEIAGQHRDATLARAEQGRHLDCRRPVRGRRYDGDGVGRAARERSTREPSESVSLIARSSGPVIRPARCASRSRRTGEPVNMTISPLNALAARLESVEALDGPARMVGRTVRAVIPRGAPKDVLSGAWLGHALHPIMTDIPIGASALARRLGRARHGRLAGRAPELHAGRRGYGGRARGSDAGDDDRVRLSAGRASRPMRPRILRRRKNPRGSGRAAHG